MHTTMAYVPLLQSHKGYKHAFAFSLKCRNSVLIFAQHSKMVLINVIANSTRKLIAVSSKQDMNTATNNINR